MLGHVIAIARNIGWRRYGTCNSPAQFSEQPSAQLSAWTPRSVIDGADWSGHSISPTSEDHAFARRRHRRNRGQQGAVYGDMIDNRYTVRSQSSGRNDYARTFPLHARHHS